MKNILPIIISVVILCSFIYFNAARAAETPTTPTLAVASVSPSTATSPSPSVSVSPSTQPQSGGGSDGQWVSDQEVTFYGKLAARSGHFLDWSLKNYQWIHIQKDVPNPLEIAWKKVSSIVYALLSLGILGAAFLLLISQGKDVRLVKFIVRFVLVVLLVTFSYALIYFIYQLMDIWQGFFFAPSGNALSAANLINISFSYGEFVGLKKAGETFSESAFMSLLLVKITSFTYYVISIILLLRKIVLWLFLVASPIFALILLFKPLEGVTKVWVGEFFRFLLYGPLFAMFLSVVVIIWQNYIPQDLNLSCADQVDTTNNVYPTSINILLGGPCQKVSLDNNLNTADAFIQYLIGLLMIWVAILLPFLLLKIILDYVNNYMVSENNLIQNLLVQQKSGLDRFFRKLESIRPTPPKEGPSGLGRALMLPGAFTNKFNAWNEQLREDEKTASVNNLTSQALTSIRNQTSDHINNEHIGTVGKGAISYSKYGTQSQNTFGLENNRNLDSQTTINESNVANQMTSSPITAHNNTSQFNDSLITNAEHIENSTSQQGVKSSHIVNTVFGEDSNLKFDSLEAKQISAEALNLANLTIPTMQEITRYETTISSENNLYQDKFRKINESLSRLAGTSPLLADHERQQYKQIFDKIQLLAKTNNNPIASTITKAAYHPTAITFPKTNQVQKVSLQDYEDVRKIWLEHYKSAEVPNELKVNFKDKLAWLEAEVKDLESILAGLTSEDITKKKQAMKLLSKVLPFLMLGGFSESEIISYLRAKKEAAKEVIGENTKKEDMKDTLVEVEIDSSKAEEKHQVAEMNKKLDF